MKIHDGLRSRKSSIPAQSVSHRVPTHKAFPGESHTPQTAEIPILWALRVPLSGSITSGPEANQGICGTSAQRGFESLTELFVCLVGVLFVWLVGWFVWLVFCLFGWCFVYLVGWQTPS